jgi:hypothetical protein
MVEQAGRWIMKATHLIMSLKEDLSSIRDHWDDFCTSQRVAYFGNMGDEVQRALQILDDAFAEHGALNKGLASLGESLDGLANTVRGPLSFA